MNVVVMYADDYRKAYQGIIAIHYFQNYMLLCRALDDYKVYFNSREHGALFSLEVYEDVKKR